MRAVSRILSALLVVAAATELPADEPSPYAGLESREVKALSEDAIAGYLEGRGMGLAMAAELNSYPGPRHVLELAGQLQLDDDQALSTRTVFDRMHERAVELGRRIVDRERELEALFAGSAASDAALRPLLDTLGRLQGELRYTHLRAHVEMRAILTPEQIALYQRLRGYAAPPSRSGCPHGG